MINNIKTQLSIIAKSIEWVNETKSMGGAKGENAIHQLTGFRRELKKKLNALEGNPAAAVYGESQVGKSYLISSLLSEDGKPFNISCENGYIYNFISDINPPGNDSESTSIVSRFSVSYKPINQKFPVKAVLLSVSDLALVLCDSFYCDVKHNYDLLLKSESINEEVKLLNEKYSGLKTDQPFLSEDDLLNMRDYFENNLSKAYEVLSSNFFSGVSKIIHKLQPDEWIEVFALLWNKNEKFTALFSRLISEYQKINFAKIIYLPIESVLYKHGTLLDVTRLKEIYFNHDGVLREYKADTDVIYSYDGLECEASVNKSCLCALSAEIIFSLPDSLLENKTFLNKSDLLDFPGARSRLSIPENRIETEIMYQLLLRGKVAYLFNKYSEYEKINILLFCAKHGNAAQRAMPEMLSNWIKKVVGDTADARQIFVNRLKIPPLFIIGTFFNVNLQFDPVLDKQNDDSSFIYRWNQRFNRTLMVELLNVEIYDWFVNWTSEQQYFQNIFLLRDFEKSESISHIFRGYNLHKRELEEVIPSAYPDFKNDLRKSFIEYDFVIRHFKNPAESWDRAASINEDGTKLIIENLTIATNNISDARYEKNVMDLKRLNESLISFLKQFYNSDDKKETLSKAITTAGRIQAELDITFGKNPYFFGEMMRELMLKNTDVYNLYLKKIKDIEKKDLVNLDAYIQIRIHVPELDANASFDTNLEQLRKRYELNTLKDCQDFFETERNIDLNELFYGNKERVKSFSQVLVEELEVYYFENHILRNQQNLNDKVPAVVLQNIQNMLRGLYKQLNISKSISDRICHYVDGYSNMDDVYEMIADISAEMINRFINTVGKEYYNASNFNDLEKAKENLKNDSIIWDHKDLEFNINNKDEVAELISIMDDLPKLLNQNPLPRESLKFLPNYRNYIIWRDLLKAGFVTVTGVPNYDPVANAKLGAIINEGVNIKY